MTPNKRDEEKDGKAKHHPKRALTKRKYRNRRRKDTIYDPDPKKDCFIGGLPIDTKEDLFLEFLKVSFPQVEITAVHFIKKKKQKKLNKGFGFVSLKTEDDMQKFLKLEPIFNGKQLDVRKATRFTEQMENVEEFYSTRVFVEGLSPKINDQDLKELFSNEFKVVRCYVIRDHYTKESKGLGFVDFVSKSEATKCLALKTFELGGSLINVEPFKIEKKLKAIEESRLKKCHGPKLPINVPAQPKIEDNKGLPIRRPAFSFCSPGDSFERKKLKSEYLIPSRQKKLNEAFMNYETRRMLKTKKICCYK